MVVFVVQRLDWKWNDECFLLCNDAPIKAFESPDDAEAFRQKQERLARRAWNQDEKSRRDWRPDNCIGDQGFGSEPDRFYEIVALELGI